jgi:hypothetical protein
MVAVAAIMDFVSVNKLKNASTNSPEFFVVGRARLEDSSFRITGAATHPRWLLWQPSWIGFHRLSDERLGRPVRFLVHIL